jgi:hypothetical protein
LSIACLPGDLGERYHFGRVRGSASDHFACMPEI